MRPSLPAPPRRALLLPGLLAVAMPPACGGEPEPHRAPFENLTLRVESLDGREVRFQHREAAFPEERMELLLDDLYVTGELGQAGAAFTTGVLYTAIEGREATTELVVAADAARGLRHVASRVLGTELRLEGLEYRGDTIVVHLMHYVGADPVCCPSAASQRHFLLRDGRLVELGEAAGEAVGSSRSPGGGGP